MFDANQTISDRLNVNLILSDLPNWRKGFHHLFP